MQSANPTNSRIIKKLLPNSPGAKRLSDRFGSALVCVRYRLDQTAGRRYTTVEIVVDSAAIVQTGDVHVRVGYLHVGRHNTHG